jgi:hypothetical protein
LGSIAYAGTLDDEVEWEHFAVQVSVLDDMADDGLVKIVARHEETKTGERNIDRVDFERTDAPAVVPRHAHARRGGK